MEEDVGGEADDSGGANSSRPSDDVFRFRSVDLRAPTGRGPERLDVAKPTVTASAGFGTKVTTGAVATVTTALGFDTSIGMAWLMGRRRLCC